MHQKNEFTIRLVYGTIGTRHNHLLMFSRSLFHVNDDSSGWAYLLRLDSNQCHFLLAPGFVLSTPRLESRKKIASFLHIVGFRERARSHFDRFVRISVSRGIPISLRWIYIARQNQFEMSCHSINGHLLAVAEEICGRIPGF